MSKFPLLFVVVITLFTTIFLVSSNKTEAAGSVSGTVYIDYNMNGARDTNGIAPNLAIDSGVSNVTVTIFASNGSSKSTTTNSAGAFTINTSSAPALPPGPYRVEFTSLPTGYSPSVIGSNNTTTVRYIPDGNNTNINLGIISNPDYCQNTPEVFLPVANYGDQDSSSSPALVRFPYNSGTSFLDTDALAESQEDSNYSQPFLSTILTAQQIGTTWGVTYQRSTGRLLIASHFKRHFGFVNDAPGAIYVANPSTGNIVSTYTVPGATTNSHLSGNTTYERDGNNTGWDAVGKQSLGGIDLSDDEQDLFVMNLENRTLYKMNANTGTVISSASTTGLTMPTPGGSNTNCTTANKRPFAIKYYQGQLYVGLVCSAQGQNASNLRAYVFRADPTTLAFESAPVVNIALNHTRGFVSQFGGNFAAAWRPWVTTYSNQAVNFQEVSYPQPILKGISFQNGNMLIGVADRFGDQVGYLTRSNPSSNSLVVANSAGDTLKLCGSPSNGWTLESNGRCGTQGNGPQNTNQGPGGAEFFYQDFFHDGGGGHQEITTGGVDVIPGVPQAISTVYDPVDQDTVTSQINWAFTQGIRFLNTSTGATDRAYFINRTENSKGNDLGQVVVACNAAALQIGNRVWMDSDRDGVQGPSESGIANVDLELFVDSSGDGIPDTLVGTDTTDTSGNYVFGGPENNSMSGGNVILPDTAYEVRVAASNFNTPSGSLAFLLPSPGAADGSANGTSRDSDGAEFGSYVRALVTTGGFAKNDHTVDFGFMLPPTHAGIIISGRVVEDSGRGITRTAVTLTDPNSGEIKTALTNPFGYFSFSGLIAGNSYIVSVSSKSHHFDPDTRFIKAYNSISDLEFIAEQPSKKTARSK